MENYSEVTFIKLIAAGMLLAFVLAASIVVFVLFYQRKLAKQVMKVQKMKLDHQEMLIKSNIQVTENERKQFASNLHDVIGAQVAITKITLSSQAETEKLDQNIITKTLGMLDEISTSIRDISYNVMPPVLIKLGLTKALEDYLKKLPNSEIQVTFNSSVGAARFSSNTELHAFRICQEAITNALKHAKCDTIVVNMEPFGKQTFKLSISDNGVGLKSNSHKGTGMLNMEYRANLMNCDFNTTSDEQGTRITITPKNQAL